MAKWHPATDSQAAKWQPPPLPVNGHSQYNVLPPPMPRTTTPSVPPPSGGGVKLKLKFGTGGGGGGGSNSAGSSQISVHTPTPPPPVRTPSAEPGRVVLKFKPATKPT